MTLTVQYYVQAIQDVTQTITDKCQVLGQILETSQSKFQAVEDTARNVVFEKTPLIKEMDQVFKELKSISVEGRGKTLFDYVDAETVKALQQDAIEQAKDVEELLDMHRHALDRISAIFEYFTSFSNKHSPHIEQILSDQVDVKAINTVYDTAVCLFVDMEQCDRFLLGYFTTINDIYPQYETLFAEAETLFDELRSLRDFYRHFLSAYLQVGPELERQCQYNSTVTRLIENTKLKLEMLEQEEIKRRTKFLEEYARYLPSSICPELRNAPTQYEIRPVVNHMTTQDGGA